MKRLVSILLTVAMLVSMIIVPTTAVEGNAAIRYSGANVDITGSSRFQHSYCYVPVDYDFVKRINNPGDELHGKWDFTMVMDFKVEDYGTGSDHFTDLTFANWDLGKWHIGYSFTHKAFVIYDLYMPGTDPNAGHYMLAQMSYDLQLDTWYELTMKYYGRTITVYLNGVEMLVADLEYLYNTVKGEDPVRGTIGTWDFVAKERPHDLDKDFFFMTAVDMDVCFDNIGWFSGDYDIATGTASKTYRDIDGDFASFGDAASGAEEGGGPFALFNHNANFKLDPNAGTEKVTYNRGAAAGHKHEWVLDSANSPAVSCLAPGYDLYVCKNGCGASEQRNYLAPLGHAPGMTVKTLLPYDDANHGVDLKMCTRDGCGMAYNALINLTDTANGALYGYTNGGTQLYNGCIVASGIGEIAAMDDGFVLEFDVMPISNVGKDFAEYCINLGNNDVAAYLGYNFYSGNYFIEINGETVAEVSAAVNEYSWYRWDIVRDGLTITLYVDNELVISAELPEEIYKITDDNGNPIYNYDGTVTTKAACFNADFRTPGCETIIDNIVIASPDFDFANTRAGVIYDKLSFNGDQVSSNGFFCGANNVIYAIAYDKTAGAGYKVEAYGRPFEDVTEIHDDRALHIDSDYENGSIWGYSQLLGDHMETFKNNVDLEFTFDFYAYDWCTDEDLLDKKLAADEDHIGSAFIGTHINGYGVGDEVNTLGNGFVGYDFIKQAAVIGSVSEQNGGYYGDNNTTFVPYAIEKDTWHTYTISYKTEFVDDYSYDNDFYVASIYIDGNLVHSVNLDLWTINADYILFFPNFVKGYLDNLTVNLGGVKLDDNRHFTNEVSKTTTGWNFSGNDWTLVSGGVPTHVYEKTVFPASCLSDGWTEYVCDCGDSNYTVYDQIAQGHSYDDGVVTLEPSATSKGIMTYTCTVCGDYYEEEIPVGGEGAFVVDENGVLTAYNGAGGDITIPETVTSIAASAFAGCTTITSVAIPDTVTSIGSSAFKGCTNLESIRLSNAITAIPTDAFRNCVSLTSIFVPDGVKSIAGGAFRSCSSLVDIYLPDSVASIGIGAFYNCAYFLDLNNALDGVLYINNHVIKGDSTLTDYVIKDGVVTIAAEAFINLTNINELTIPDSVKNVGSNAFKGCTNITIRCNYGSYIASYAESKGINYRYLGDYVVVDNTLIQYNGKATDAVIPEGVTAIADNAFTGCTITSVEIPATVTTIGDLAFDGCADFEIICEYNSAAETYAKNKGISYSYVSDFVVDGNGTLTKYVGNGGDIVIPNGVITIGDNVFYGNSDITGVVIPESVKTIGKYAFYNCTNLTEVSIPEGITVIPEYSFAGCSSLESVEIPSTVTSISSSAFNKCYALADINIADGNSVYSSVDGVLFSADGKTLIQYPAGKAAAIYAVPEKATSINQYAFSNNAYLTKVTIPDTVTEMGVGIFLSCTALEEANIPVGITVLPSNTFRDCTALKSVVIPGNITAINSNAFYNCSALEWVAIPETVTSVAVLAFDKCTSLKDVYYGGSADAWTSVSIASSNNYLKNATFHYNVTDVENHFVYTVTLEPTCTEDGAAAYICSCGYSKDEEKIPANGHAIVNHDGKAPTCTEIGWEAYETCENCDYTTYVEISANGHAIVNHDGKAATCTEIGWEAYETCENCDYTTYIEIPTNGHAIVNHEGKPATCTDIGWEAYETCENCDYTTYVEITASSHAIVNHDGKDATCTESGWNAYETCENCDYTTYAEIPALGHRSFMKFEGRDPTCTESGCYPYVLCEYCDYTTYVEIPANGHAIVNHEGKAPTCTENGWEAYETCENCDYTTYVEIPTNGHSWDDGVITTEPDGDIPGVMTYTCTSCGETREESIEGHTHTYVTEETSATCTEDGYRKVYCSVCGDVQSEEPIPAKGHSPANDLSCIYVELATCTKGGSITKLCPDCGEVASYEETAPLNHMLDAVTDAFGEKYIGLYPTVEVEGYYAKKCKLCGFETVCEPIEKLHDADFMVIDGVLVEYLGQGGIAKIPGNVTTIGEGAFAGKTGIISVVVPANVTSIESGAFSGMNTTVIFLGNATEWGSVAKADGWDTDSTIKMVYGEIKFSGASITLENDLKVNYKIDKKYFEQYGFENPYVVFSIGDETVTVTDYTVVGSSYIFSYCDISPKMMNDVIKAKLYTSYDGNEYTATKNDYSIASYCYSLLTVYSSDANAELRTLLVDMLNYGAASQIYTEYNTNNLANARLTAKQKTWATSTTRDYVSVLDTKYEVIDNATVTWKSAGLVLGDSVIMRYKFAASDISDLTVKIEADGNEWFISSDEFEATTNGYYVYFDKFIATQMSETVLVTVYDGDTAVSNTLSYSIESYVDSMQDYENENFQNLMEMMMKYGDSAYAYAN